VDGPSRPAPLGGNRFDIGDSGKAFTPGPRHCAAESGAFNINFHAKCNRLSLGGNFVEETIGSELFLLVIGNPVSD
jgi:hypothetical protein